MFMYHIQSINVSFYSLLYDGGVKSFLVKNRKIPGMKTAIPKIIAPDKMTAPRLRFAIAPLAISSDFFTGIEIKGTLNANSI